MSRLALAAALLVAVLAASCASLPRPADAARTVTTTSAITESRVLGRSDRFVIYQPAPGDTLASIAGRLLGDASRGWVIADFNEVAEAEPDRPLAVPLQSLNPLGIEFDRYQSVPILCYHRFGNGPGKMVISAAKFEAQLDWLAKNRYHVIPLARLPGFLDGREALPKRSAVLTIDDGY